jgi:molecular chaperone GrpE
MTERKRRAAEEPAAETRRPHEPAATAAGAAAPSGPSAAAVEDGSSLAEDDPRRLAVERDEYLEHLQRLKAEFDNYRKRVQRDTESLRLRAAEGVVESLLPVMDNMQRALEAAERHEEGQLIQGVELVAGQFRAVLSSHGLEKVPTEPGAVFDPTVHEAVLVQRSNEFESGSVLAVLECGYLLHGRLLRPAKVIVTE